MEKIRKREKARERRREQAGEREREREGSTSVGGVGPEELPCPSTAVKKNSGLCKRTMSGAP